eukprot:scaffold285725_cov29-Tisochrysis_lutea.AAC.5
MLCRFCSETERWRAKVISESLRLIETAGQERLGVPGATGSIASSIVTLSRWPVLRWCGVGAGCWALAALRLASLRRTAFWRSTIGSSAMQQSVSRLCWQKDAVECVSLSLARSRSVLRPPACSFSSPSLASLGSV